MFIKLGLFTVLLYMLGLYNFRGVVIFNLIFDNIKLSLIALGIIIFLIVVQGVRVHKISNFNFYLLNKFVFLLLLTICLISKKMFFFFIFFEIRVLPLFFIILC